MFNQLLLIASWNQFTGHNLYQWTRSFLFLDCHRLITEGLSAYMTGTPSTLSSLTLTTSYPPVSIEDGRPCSIKWYGSTKPTVSLTLHNVLYILDFLVNLLSIRTIVYTIIYVAILYPFHCVFQDLRTSQRIGLASENCENYDVCQEGFRRQRERLKIGRKNTVDR